jgi:hypothetical protein
MNKWEAAVFVVALLTVIAFIGAIVHFEDRSKMHRPDPPELVCKQTTPAKAHLYYCWSKDDGQ